MQNTVLGDFQKPCEAIKIDKIHEIQCMQIVSLITDYGLTDTYLAELKAGMLSRCKDIFFLDICHQVDINEITSAAYLLKNMLPLLPESSINLVSVNNYYKPNPAYLVFNHESKYFIGPDNGIFSLVFDNLDLVYAIDTEKIDSRNVNEIYCHAIACINHELHMEEFAMKIDEIDKRLAFRPVVNSSQIRASIIHVDHFGNVITNITKDTFEKVRANRSFSIYFKPNDPLHHVCKAYSDVSVGEVLGLFNQAGNLEIAINCGNASNILHLYKNETIQIDFY